jgi:DNA-binding MarR family transcriptional regulator
VKRPGRPGPRYRPLLQLLRTAETLWNASRVFFDRWELSPSQFNLLNLLHEQAEGFSQSDLGRELIMHRSNVTGLVDRLEQRGLVARRDSAKDRRAWRVVLTPAGRGLVEAILPDYYAAAETVWGRVPSARAAKLVRELSVLDANAIALAQQFGRRQT